jgi:hypothetical protein
MASGFSIGFIGKKETTLKGIDSQKISQSVSDVVRLGTQEVLRGVAFTKESWKKYHLLQKRKDLLAELGRTTYDAVKPTGGTELTLEVCEVLKQGDFADLVKELEVLDTELLNLRKE